ncbi:unnamed protein product [Cuscuta campestris]|uniref:Protein kinase domain-containing protein n=1 Tax=Cuscuta campestris TaxID=132261 RepID=A0A484L531_9ASTE|nr:unnamed protein product [Cuscuta campestris]
MVYGVTNANDLKILIEFKNGLENSELLKWPAKGNDPCGPPTWPHIVCSKGRVTQIHVQGLGLSGPLPQDFNQLDNLESLGLQKNDFYGKLPTFNGLENLQSVNLDGNQFDTIPSSFFHGLNSIRVLTMDDNPLNKSTGWSIPLDLQGSTQLANFSCSNCNIVGTLPGYFAELPSLVALKLSGNRLSGSIPNSFRQSMLQVLWLNNQGGDGMTGSIDVIGSMVRLKSVWLNGNRFSGEIPDNIGNLTSLKDLNLNGNQLVGLVPKGLADLNLQALGLHGNLLMGAIPKFRASKVTYSSNSFCQQEPGEPCAPEVNALIQFLHEMNYPPRLAAEWTGNDPCKGQWWGITCNPNGNVSIINLQKLDLEGTLSPSLASLNSLVEIRLPGNHLHGKVPAELTSLRSLRLLDISGNNFDLPFPQFNDRVKVITDGNLALSPSSSLILSPPDRPFTPLPDPSFLINGSLTVNHSPPSIDSPQSMDSPPPLPVNVTDSDTKSVIVFTVAVSVASTVLVLLCVIYLCYLWKKRRPNKIYGATMFNPSKDRWSDDIRITISDESPTEDGTPNLNILVPLHILRSATNNFSPHNEIGRGGFGVVYKGVLDNGTQVAVKRMEAGIVSGKVVDEFQAEIAVLSKVRHRHLVSLLGYSMEGNERLLVYEYMGQGALSKHLFHWRSLDLEPLSWTKRLIIALDVARGMEYLHSLTHQSFIHRDLKSSNILLGNDFRAKVSDFGLVKLAPDRDMSVATRLAGTFGYLAPEYAVTGKITTKVDVFSFGMVLMELLTGLTALDERRSEERRYLLDWFWKMKAEKETLLAAIDPTLEPKEQIYDSICIVAELAGHCTSSDPNHRPEMGHAVNVLAQQVETWKPVEHPNDCPAIDLSLPLPQMLKIWQNERTEDFSYLSPYSKGKNNNAR